MPIALIEALTQFGTLLIFVVIGVVLMAVAVSGTSIGRAMLPTPVNDVVSKLLPRALIADANATGHGDFELQVHGAAHLKTVHVRCREGMTIAWAYDPALEYVRTGTFAFSSFSHNLKPDAILEPAEVHARIQRALTEVLAAKKYQRAEPQGADILISVVGAIEDEMTLGELDAEFDRPDGHEWRQALSTAMSHDADAEVTVLARGSLVLQVLEAKSMNVLWRAAAIADVTLDVSDAEKQRRTSVAVSEMLKQFPPT